MRIRAIFVGSFHDEVDGQLIKLERREEDELGVPRKVMMHQREQVLQDAWVPSPGNPVPRRVGTRRPRADVVFS